MAAAAGRHRFVYIRALPLQYWCVETRHPQPGEIAPQFIAIAIGGPHGNGTRISLEEFRGKTVVLYFYPKDDTPGCTAQACGLRDAWDSFSDVVVFGISTDSLDSHRDFIAKHSLPFPLLSDETRDIVQKYGVWVEKQRAGETYMGTERTTFVIGPDQKIEHVLRQVNPTEHASQLAAAIGQ
jgi:thioredoxin-dependent peroxiredoxin